MSVLKAPERETKPRDADLEAPASRRAIEAKAAEAQGSSAKFSPDPGAPTEARYRLRFACTTSAEETPPRE